MLAHVVVTHDVKLDNVTCPPSLRIGSMTATNPRANFGETGLIE
jgi:hypothetical protein